MIQKELGKNFVPFTLYRDELDDPTEAFVRTNSVTYKNRKCFVMNNPIMVGRNGKLMQQGTVQLVTNREDDCIIIEYDGMFLGDHIYSPEDNRHEWLKKKFSFIETELDFEGLKELDVWWEERIYREGVYFYN